MTEEEELIIAALLLDSTLGEQYEEAQETEAEQGEEYHACYCLD